MPLTTFHFGLALGIGYLLRNRIHLPTFLLTNVITDLEPALVLALQLPIPHHGIVHTFLFSIFLGLILSYLMFKLKKLKTIYKRLLINDSVELNFKSYLVSGITGTNLHVFLDSFIHDDMFPFFPLNNNILYSKEFLPIAIVIITSTCFIISMLGLYLYFSKFYMEIKNHNINIGKLDKIIFILAYVVAVLSYLHYFNLNLFISNLIYLIVINILVIISIIIYKLNKHLGLCLMVLVSLIIIFIFSLSISAIFGFYFYNPYFLIPFIISSVLFLIFALKIIYNYSLSKEYQKQIMQSKEV